MDQVTFPFIATVIPSVSLKPNEFLQLSGMWAAAAGELIKNYMQVNVIVDLQSQKMKISNYQKSKNEESEYTHCSSFTLGVSINIGKNRNWNIEPNWEELRFSKNLREVIRIPCAPGMHHLEVDGIDPPNANPSQNAPVFDMQEFFTSIVGPFAIVNIHNCRGYASEVEEVVRRHAKADRTIQFGFNATDLTSQCLDLLVNQWAKWTPKENAQPEDEDLKRIVMMNCNLEFGWRRVRRVIDAFCAKKGGNEFKLSGSEFTNVDTFRGSHGINTPEWNCESHYEGGMEAHLSYNQGLGVSFMAILTAGEFSLVHFDSALLPTSQEDQLPQEDA